MDELPKSLRIYSCVICQTRKVKCDKQEPCSRCVKAGVECNYRIPPPPKRRARKSREVELLGKIRQYQDLLQDSRHQQDDDSSETEEMSTECGLDAGWYQSHPAQGSQSHHLNTGNMISPHSGNGLRYSNPNQRAGMSSKYTDSNVLESKPEGLFLCDDRWSTASEVHVKNNRNLFPPPVQIYTLWQTFLENINPLVKLIHAPSLQRLILQATRDNQALSKGEMALMYAIFLTASISLAPCDCENLVGEPKSVVLERFSLGLRRALGDADFLQSTDIAILQAFTLWLITLPSTYDPNALWLLTGTAVRMAQRLSLHNEDVLSKLPPFEAEMRRRLWWQIVLVEGRATQVSASGPSILNYLPMVKTPSNLNDADLFPDMKDTPENHSRPTEMLFASIRFEITTFFWTSQEKLHITSFSLADKDRFIDKFEKSLREKYLMNTDPSIPFHFVCIALVRLVMCKIRLKSHHPRQYPDNGASLPLSERDLLFGISLELTELAMKILSDPAVERYVWHMMIYFPHFHIEAFILLLGELRYRTSGSLVDNAWHQVGKLYQHHRQIITDQTHASYVAVGDLTLQAWAARESCLTSQGHIVKIPDFIALLRQQRPTMPPLLPLANNSKFGMTANIIATSAVQPAMLGAHIPNGGTTLDNFRSAGQLEITDPDFTPVDWAYWDDLIQNCDLIPLGDDFIDYSSIS